MLISPLAGKPAPRELLVDPSRLEREYFERRPDLQDRNQLVINRRPQIGPAAAEQPYSALLPLRGKSETD